VIKNKEIGLISPQNGGFMLSALILLKSMMRVMGVKPINK